MESLLYVFIVEMEILLVLKDQFVRKIECFLFFMTSLSLPSSPFSQKVRKQRKLMGKYGCLTMSSDVTVET